MRRWKMLTAWRAEGSIPVLRIIYAQWEKMREPRAITTRQLRYYVNWESRRILQKYTIICHWTALCWGSMTRRRNTWHSVWKRSKSCIWTVCVSATCPNCMDCLLWFPFYRETVLTVRGICIAAASFWIIFSRRKRQKTTSPLCMTTQRQMMICSSIRFPRHY